MPESVKEILISDANASGMYDAYKATARLATATHLYVPRSAYDRINAPPEPHTTAPPFGRVPSVASIFGSVVHGVVSMAKTAAGIDVATAEEQAQRLAQCATCAHVVKKNAKPHTCGPFLNVLKMQKRVGPGCGCLLDQKTRDIKEECPLEGDQKRWHKIIRLPVAE